MQAVRNTIRLLSRPSPPPQAGLISATWSKRLYSQQSAAAACSAFLDKQEVTDRVLNLLRSAPFIDPAKVNPTADFKKDLQLDMLDNLEVVMAAEEEFAVEIPSNKADKISTAAHLIDYIAAHPQAK